MKKTTFDKCLLNVTFLILTVPFVIPSFAYSSIANFGENLLINPDAETMDVQGWIDPDDAWSAAADITPHGGDYFFWPERLDIPYTQMYQDVDISEYASNIDSGNIYFHLSGWLANWDQYPHDCATLAIEALDANNQQLLYLSRDNRSPVWTYYKIESQIPYGCRTLRVYLIATRYVGNDNDGYFDDLCLEVDENVPNVFITITSEEGVTEIAVDGTLQLNATTAGGIDSTYIWSSSFNALATVDENGLVTAHKPGRFTIQANGTSTHAIGYLEFVAYSPNYIIITNPQNGEKWEAGTDQNITWNLIGNIDSGILYYSTTGGSEWIESDNISDLSAQQHLWHVPDSDEILNNCILKIIWSGSEATSSAFSIVTSVTIVEESIPFGFKLINPYPNPFNPVTTIEYNLQHDTHITLIIYNSMGQEVSVLKERHLKAGNYSITWNASDKPTGLYFCTLKANGYTETRKMVLVK